MVYIKYVDLNSDLGEGFASYKMGMDEEVLGVVTSANIACGWHGGDPTLMMKTAKLAKENQVAIGAHPAYPDLLGFGRRNLDISPGEAKAYVIYQVGAMDAFARAEGLELQHVKLHGAFYNTAMEDEDLARAVIEACQSINPNLVHLALSGSKFFDIARSMGAKVSQEVFADRAYNDDKSLVSRKIEGSVITDEEEAIARTIRMVKEGLVRTINGKDIEIVADSICVHGDNPKALAFVKKIRQALREENIGLRALGKNL